MAEGLTARAVLLLLALGASGAGQAALGQALRDPTRPPDVAASQPASEATSASGTRLQSVLLSAGRKLAVIDGQTVPLGGRIADATVVEISAGHVVLRRGVQTQTLRLHPAADKKPVTRAVP
jgi:MSHA biogenesis protein MshK